MKNETLNLMWRKLSKRIKKHFYIKKNLKELDIYDCGKIHNC